MKQPKTFIRTVAVFLLLCLMIPFPGFAASSEEIRQEINKLEKQQDDLQKRIEALQKSITENREELQGLIAEKQNLDQQISLVNSQLLLLDQQILSMKQLIADKEEQYEEATAKYEELSLLFRARVRSMEEQGTVSYWSVLFRSSSFSDFLDRLEMIREIARADRRRMEQLSAAASAVENTKSELEAQKGQLEAAKDVQLSKMGELQQMKEKTEELVRLLDAKGAEYEALLDRSEQEQDELMQQIANMEDEFDKAAYEEWLAAQPPVVKPPQITESVTNGITWVVPVPYYTLTSPFGMRLHPIHGDYRMHNGIDMACAEGTPIYATRNGQVEIAKWSDSAGNYVQINHGDGYRSVYMHMTHYIVSSGQYVQAGQTIGYVGNTGASKGNHLHFGVSYNGTYINPYPLISG